MSSASNGVVIATSPSSTAADAMAAQKAWQALPAITCARHLYAICERLRAEREHFAELLVVEQGKPLVQARGEVDGKAPFIVLEDADIEFAATAVVEARFANCGQVCICAVFVLVDEAVGEAFTSRVLAHVARLKVGDHRERRLKGQLVRADCPRECHLDDDGCA